MAKDSADETAGARADHPSAPATPEPDTLQIAGEALWRAVVEQSPFSTVVYDPQGRPLVVNAAFRALFGVGLESVPAGYSVLADPELEQQGILEDVREAFRGRPMITPVVRYDVSRVSTTGTGNTRWTQGHFYPLLDAGHRVAHVVLTHIDLTDRIRAEEALRASEQRFGAIVHQASVGIAQADAAGRFVLVNDRYCEMVGRSRDELLQLRMQDITHPDDLADNLPLFARALATGEPFTIEKRYCRPDGSVVWVSNSVAAVRDSSETESAVLAVAIDISGRRRAEEFIRVLAEAGRVLTSSLDYTTTLSNIARLVVPAVARWSIVFLDDEGIEPVATACDAPEKADAVQAMARCIGRISHSEPHLVRLALETREPQLVRTVDTGSLDWATADAEYRRLADELAPVSLIAVPLLTQGRALGAIVLATDDRSRHFDEQDLALAAELAQRAAVAVDNARLYQAEQQARTRTERLQQITSRLAAALPVEEVGELFASQVREAFNADTAWLGLLDADRAHFVALAHTGFAEQGIAPWLRFPADTPVPAADVIRDGRGRWFRSAEAMRDAYPATAETVKRIEQEAVAFLPLAVGNSVLGVMSLGFREQRHFGAADREFGIALAHQCAQALERARLYEAERAARAEAEAASRAKSEFLAKMSHELRTPLNAIGGYAELIELGIHGGVTAEQRAALERIQFNQRHLLNLITDILDFSRVEAGTLRLVVDDVEVEAVLSAVEPMIEPQMQRKGVHFEVSAPRCPLRVRGDRERIVQICLNLLSNALKATPAGGTIRLGCEPSADRATFSVRDTGSGIAQDQLEAIFNPFTQLGRSLNNPRDGVGLGLAISRELARAMHGELVAASEPGAGSTFSLSLPLAGNGHDAAAPHAP